MARMNLRGSFVLPILLALAACGGQGGSGETSAQTDPKTAAKVSAYTDSYNELIDTSGLTETADTYREAAIATRSASDNIRVSQGRVEVCQGKLKAARALSGSLGPLDAKAEALDNALTKVLARLGPLYGYYNTKAYRDDDLKRGKAEDAAMLADFDAALKALDEFNGELIKQRRATADAELAELKADGNIVGYNNKQAMMQAEDLLALFTKPEDAKNPAVVAKADAIVAKLSALLDEQRKAIAEAKTKDLKPIENSRVLGAGAVIDVLGTMIGNYRELKRSGSPDKMEAMVSNYNTAVSLANGMN